MRSWQQFNQTWVVSFCQQNSPNGWQNVVSVTESQTFVSRQRTGLPKEWAGILQTVMKAMLTDTNLPMAYWAEAIGTVYYIVNRVWSRSINDIPYKLLRNRDPKLNYLRVFGNKALVNVPLKQRWKGGERDHQYIFVGYQASMKGYLFVTSQKKVCFSHSASFNEHSNWERFHGQTLMSFRVLANNPRRWKSNRRLMRSFSLQGHKLWCSQLSMLNNPEYQVGHKRAPPIWFGFKPVQAQANFVRVCESKSYQEAMQLESSEKAAWIAALQKEYKSLINHNVFSLAELPEGKSPVGYR